MELLCYNCQANICTNDKAFKVWLLSQSHQHLAKRVRCLAVLYIQSKWFIICNICINSQHLRHVIHVHVPNKISIVKCAHQTLRSMFSFRVQTIWGIFCCTNILFVFSSTEKPHGYTVVHNDLILNVSGWCWNFVSFFFSYLDFSLSKLCN